MYRVSLEASFGKSMFAPQHFYCTSKVCSYEAQTKHGSLLLLFTMKAYSFPWGNFMTKGTFVYARLL